MTMQLESKLIALSQIITSVYQDKTPVSFGEINSVRLAAMTFESIANTAHKDEVKNSLMFESAVAYSMIGDFDDTQRLLNSLNLDAYLNQPDYAVIIATINPSSVKTINSFQTPFKDYIALINYYFNEQQEGDSEQVLFQLNSLLIECLLKAQDSFTNSLLRCCRKTLVLQVQKKFPA